MNQYRIIVNNSTQEIKNEYPVSWDDAIRKCNERGQGCKLERRLVVDNPANDWLEGLKGDDGKLPNGSMMLGNKFVSNWVTIADNCDRVGLLIG